MASESTERNNCQKPVAIYATIGNFFAGHLMLAIGALTVTAGLLSSRRQVDRASD